MVVVVELAAVVEVVELEEPESVVVVVVVVEEVGEVWDGIPSTFLNAEAISDETTLVWFLSKLML